MKSSIKSILLCFFSLSLLFLVSCKKDKPIEIPSPNVVTSNATEVHITSAILNGSVNARNNTVAVSFEFGRTTSYGSSALAIPNQVGGDVITTVSVTIDTLSINTPYHFRIKAVTSNSTVFGNDMTFNTSDGLKDIDGNVYPVAKIGNQVWMAENLKVTHYRNGESIPYVTDKTQWSTLTTGAYCTYDNSMDYKNLYGCLYNWFTVIDPRNIAPEGWHVPSVQELTELVNFLGGADVAGGKLKEMGILYWDNPNTGAINTYGFSGRGGGLRAYNGNFEGYHIYGVFSSTTVYDQSMSYLMVLYNDKDDGVVGWGTKGNGINIRCIRD